MSLEIVFMHNKTIQIYFVTQKKTQSNPKLVVSSSRCTQVLRILAKNLPTLKHVTRIPDSSYQSNQDQRRSKEIRQANGSIITHRSLVEIVWFIMKITSSPFSTNFKGTKVRGKQGCTKKSINLQC